MKIESLKREKPLCGNEKVTIKTCGHIVEVSYLSVAPHDCPIINLDKNRYIVVSTGEVLNKKHQFKRIDNIATVKKSQADLRDLINANTSHIDRCKWITLTYKENMTDYHRAYKDFDKFNKRLKYNYPQYEYIVAIEPQERGAWHFHLLLIFKETAPYISNNELSALWGNGFTKTQSLENVDNIGAYLTAYLSNIPISNPNNSNAKKFKKGARLKLYPVGMRIYRNSRGVEQPVITKTSAAKAFDICRRYKKTYESNIQLTLDDGFTITIYKQFYKIVESPKIEGVGKYVQQKLNLSNVA